MTRAEHLSWAKRRALEYVDHGDLASAVASLSSDLRKHPDINPAAELLYLGLMYAAKGNAADVRYWIEGFN